MPAAVSTQKEVGIRYSSLRGLTASVSAFQITRANAVTDPQTLIFAQNGKIDYQGTIPGYTLFTAGLGYQIRSGTSRAIFLVNVDNIANVRVWNSVQTGTYGTGMDRSIKMSARFDL